MTTNKNFFDGLFGKNRSTDQNQGADDGVNALETSPGKIAAPTEGSGAHAAGIDKDKLEKQGFFARLAGGLSRSSQRLSDSVSAIVTKRRLDDETLDELEEVLIAGDLGVAAAGRVREALARDRFNKEASDEEVRDALAGVVADSLKDREVPLLIDPAHRPHVILMVGVNGAGKTTTIGKLAQKFRRDGRKVMLAAGDTFRAAAVEQLRVWGERTGAETIAKETGADAAGLAYEALERAKREKVDVLMIDTAGRLQNKKELMDELAKIVRVLKKLDPEAPHATLLVLDATVGQNAISQADAFRSIAGVTGIVMTKLDGTARGGVLVALAEKHALPIHFIGVGESADDLQPFSAAAFARALAGLSSLGERG
ncbi:MAG TPA: signal recognition particle-docking protein FtsY [Parvularculaceae bacterium]|nr:signal recognition particle-docking protein FtsY [Parvularculaceae bacterium]